MKAAIVSTGSYLPERRVHNDDLARIMDTSDEWIFSRTGIRYRHIADESEAASDLAVQAATRALERSRTKADQLDMIILATSTPDFMGLPSTAAIVQDRLQAGKAAAMDVVAACSGFVYALDTARAFIESGSAARILVVGSEVYSKILNWDDRTTAVLFGDGAGAVVVEAVPDDHGSCIAQAILRAEGAGAETLYRSHGGTRYAYVPGQTHESELKLQMDGRAVYMFAVRAVGAVIQELLERESLVFDDVDWVIPHQANVRILTETAKRRGYDLDRFYVNIEQVANTSAASIPIALDEMVSTGKLTRGMRIMTVGFGSGLTYGGTIIRW